jgi:hypothetical protein
MWQYWWYGDPDQKAPDPWREWYDAQDSSVQGRHDNVFKFLETRTNWTKPYTKKINNFVEIILKGDVQHRLLGFYWPPGKLNFTFLLTCTHKGNVYDPKDAFRTADTRIKKLVNGSKWIRRCVRPE